MAREDGHAEEIVRRMTGGLRHRGPDGQGLFTDSGAGLALGHQRLAILDLTDAGRQPMVSHDRRWVIVFNGEVFNYLELRGELGMPFRTATDTEVLLEACARWGVEQALERSIGMFAFALWDTHERELWLARDRAGEKPLVYHWDGRALAFASELKALGELAGRRLDPEAVDAYLALGYVPAPLAIFQGCRKLPPGHLLRFREGTIAVRRWWLPERAGRPAPQVRRERMEKLRELVSDAVRLRLRADVPMALYLSGGVDSSVIAAECVHQGARPAAFTVSFDGDETDLPYASRVAGALGLKHEVLRFGKRDLSGEVEKMAGHFDEPFADSSAMPSFTLAHALAGRYKLVLHGDGGDEVFGGYRHYEHIRIKQALKAAAAALGWCDGRGGGPFEVYVQSKAMFRAEERAQLLNGNGQGNALAKLLAADGFLMGELPLGARVQDAEPRRDPAASPERDAGSKTRAAFREVGQGNPLKRALWIDRHLYLPNDLTYKMDIALGSAGIEGRAPFLDHRLLEWAQSLSPDDLVRGGEKKILLRAAYRGILPDEVLDRDKQGFGAPVGGWLRGPLRAAAQEILPCPLLDRARQQALTGQRLWTLFAFASWARHWKATW